MEELADAEAPPSFWKGSAEHLQVRCWACGGVGHFAGACSGAAAALVKMPPAEAKETAERKREAEQQKLQEGGGGLRTYVPDAWRVGPG